MPRRFFTSPIGMTVLFGASGAPATPTIGMYDSTGLIQIPDGDVTPTSGDGTDYGLSATLTTITKTFTIKNTGTGTATGVSVGLSGSGSGGFTVTVAPDATIAAAGETTFQIRYDALTPIAYTATVTVSGSNFTSQTFTITASSDYDARILSTSPYDFRKINEGSGTSVADSSTNAHTAGTGTGITWDNSQSFPMGGYVAVLDGTNDYINLNDATFNANFNLDEFTIMWWAKMSGAGVWTDSTARYWFQFANGTQNYVRARRTSNNGQIEFTRVGNNILKSVAVSSQSDTGVVCYAISCSIAGGGLLNAGDLRAYKNGVEIGTAATGNLARSGSGFASTTVVIGALNTTPTSVMSAYMGRFIIWNSPMTTARLAYMTV